jgi:hypothetical protein
VVSAERLDDDHWRLLQCELHGGFERNPIWPDRRPANLYRLILAPTITLFGKVVLPFNIVLSSRETNTLTPATISPTLWQYFPNPLNTLGVTFSPGVDWMTINLGTHTPRYSEFAGSEIQIFGAGVMATPSVIRLGFNAGISKRAISPDRANNIFGAYRRTMMLGKIGVGTEAGGYVDLNIVKIRDDTTDFVAKRIRSQQASSERR